MVGNDDDEADVLAIFTFLYRSALNPKVEMFIDLLTGAARPSVSAVGHLLTLKIMPVAFPQRSADNGR